MVKISSDIYTPLELSQEYRYWHQPWTSFRKAWCINMDNLKNDLATETVVSRIYIVRNQRVMPDSDLAELYGVPTRVFNQAVKRNIDRFPADFMFQLTDTEHDSLRSRIVTSNQRGGCRYLPYAFTEHGAIMAATILNSQRAIEMRVFIVRAFIQLRDLLSSHKQLSSSLDDLERKLASHDRDITMIVNAISNLITPPSQKKRQIGFAVDEEENESCNIIRARLITV